MTSVMPVPRPSVVLFDLDGTVGDSAPGILASLRYAFEVCGIPPLDPITERSLLGPPFYTSLPPLIGGEHNVRDVIAAYRDHYRGGAMFDCAAYPGIAEVLTRLRAAGLRLAIATSKPEAMAVPIVDKLGFADLFETVGGDELDGSRGTKALVIAEVLARLRRPPAADVAMVGDREHDVLGAREHGITCIGAGWGYSLPGELAAAGAAPVCATPLDLLPVLGLDAVGGRGAPAS